MRKELTEMRQRLLSGWNTRDNRSVLTHVLLPQGCALVIAVTDRESGSVLEHVLTGNRDGESEHVYPHAHSPDGAYTELDLRWKGLSLKVQTAADDNDLTVLITPIERSPGMVSARLEYPYTQKPGRGERTSPRTLRTEKDGTVIVVTGIGNEIDGTPNAIHFDLNAPVCFTTKEANLNARQEHIALRQRAYAKNLDKYGEHRDIFNAVQCAVNWTSVYDPDKDRMVTPVSRRWAYGYGKGQPGGFVLFCWDNLFAAYMHSLESKDLAFNEAIEMCSEVDELGFIPNGAGPRGWKSRDRSQPPVGSMMVKAIYERWPEKWFLEEVFDRLLTWNRYWQERRCWDGFLCWGSHPYTPVLNDPRETMCTHAMACNESGLDNTPMYDNVAYNEERHLLEISDVGLMALYVADCEALAWLAEQLGRTKAKHELDERAAGYLANLLTMWDDARGIFLNRHTLTHELNPSISPSNFYPMIARAATNEQAQRMIDEHFYNPDEFWSEYILPSIARNDNGYTGKDYWRGSIWAPMNFLVYLGMRNYDIPKARADLADKSAHLLMQEFRQYGHIRENYDAATGTDPGDSSQDFYHWGALLGMIKLMETGLQPAASGTSQLER